MSHDDQPSSGDDPPALGARLLHSLQLERAIFEAASDAMLLADDEGRYVDANQSACRLYGVSREALIAQTPEDSPTSWGLATREALQRFIHDGARTTFSLARPDGEQRDVELDAWPNVVPGRHLFVLRDVTSQRKAERALQRSSERFEDEQARARKAQEESRQLVEQAQAVAQVGSWVAFLGPPLRLRLSREARRLLGLREDGEPSLDSFFARVHPDDAAHVRERYRAAVERGTPLAMEYRLVLEGGAVRWVFARADVERGANGAPIRLTGFVQNVTERHRFVEELTASEQRYRRIVEGTSEGVFTTDTDGRFTFVNPSFAAMLGWEREALRGRSSFELADGASAAAARDRLEERRRGAGGTYEQRYERRDGTGMWALVNAAPLRDARGRFEGELALVTDITARRRADEVRSRLVAIVEQSNDAILSTDFEGMITSWNDAAERLFEYTAAEAVGARVSMLVPDEVAGDEQRIQGALRAGETIRQYETRRRRKDGTVLDVSLSVSPIRDASGAIVEMSKVVRDMTEQRRTEASLRQTEAQLQKAQKLEAIGALAGGIAHDFNNMLSVILCCAHLVLDELPASDPLRSDIEDIVSAGGRASELTRQLLAFGRQQILEPRVLDLRALLDGMQRMLERTLREDIELTVTASPELARVFADPGQVEQMLMNLVVNARDAMPEGGRLAVEVSNATLEGPYVTSHPSVLPGYYVRISVSDTGVGMDAATKERIFEPFFSTKEKSKGSGLGLSTVFGIVRQSGGHIDVRSERGAGTRFDVYLPRTERDDDDAVSLTVHPSVLQGSETLLLVEDDAQVSRTMRGILQKQGYEVIEASNGAEALLIGEASPAKIDLLITDVVMPRLSGRQLAERLTRTRPTMKVLFVSGHAEAPRMQHHGVLDATASFFLAKPITPELLARKVREVLDAPLRPLSPLST